MASGTTDHTLTGTYALISGSELYVAGLVTGGYPVELWYGVAGAQGSNKGIVLSPGDDFSFSMGAGDGLYARAVSGTGYIQVVRRAS